MHLSKTELQLIEQIGIGLITPKDLAIVIKKNLSQTYISLNSLEDKGLITKTRNNIVLAQKSFVRLLTKLLIDNSNLIRLLANSGIPLLSLLTSPLSIDELIIRSNLKKSIIYKKINQAINISVLKKDKNKYFLNNKT